MRDQRSATRHRNRKTPALHKALAILVVCPALWTLSPGVAGPVFTWIDTNGVTHYSDTPPPEGSREPARFELAPPVVPAYPASAEDYFSILNQAERMERSRLENERLRIERLRAEAEARQAAAYSRPPPAPAETSTGYYPAYPWFGYRPGYHPGFRPGPGFNRPTSRFPVRSTARAAPMPGAVQGSAPGGAPARSR